MVSRGRYVFVYTSYKAYSLQSSNGRSYIPTAPKPVCYGNRVLRVLLGTGWGLRISWLSRAILKSFGINDCVGP